VGRECAIRQGDKHYLITRRGVRDLGSAGMVAIQEGQQRLFEGWRELERGCVRVSERDRDRGAELRAERIRWRGRSRSMSRDALLMGERLRKLNDQASLLDKRLRLHSDQSKSWHATWDDPSRPG
jgi:hypothetical protein